MFVLFFLGLFIGSFLNVFIYRWPKGEGWVRGRSKCTKCRKQIEWYDNIPLISWLVLRGRCRWCGRGISLIYPAIELINALGWVGIGWLGLVGYEMWGVGTLGWSGDGLVRMLVMIVLYSTLVVILAIDWQHQLIPDEMNWILIILGVILLMIDMDGWVMRLVSGLAASGFLGSIYLLTGGRGMGLGDVKMAVGMGLMLSGFVGVAFAVAFITGSVVGLVLVALAKAGFRKPIAFGPFLVWGMLVSLLWGGDIWGWYVGMMYL